MKDATLRIVTALVAAPVVVGLAYVGGWPFGVLVLGGALASQWEVYDLLERGGGQPRRVLGLLLGVVFVLRVFLPILVPLGILLVLFLIGLIPFEHEKRQPLVSLAGTVFGAVYPTALLAFILEIRMARGPQVGDAEAFFLVLLVLFLVWAADIGAYYVGRALGRRALAPRISPNKTWEGGLGGLFSALLVAVAFKLTVLGFLAWPHTIVLACIGGGIGQIGDLAESRLKRSAALKDSGWLLPGHGGLLDRFDAMIFVAPLAYLYLRYIAGLFG